MIENIGHYRIDEDDEGQLLHLHDTEGNPIPTVPDNEDYCEFLHWMSGTPLRKLYKPDSPSYFFCSMQRFCDFCKNSGIMLHAHQLEYQTVPRLTSEDGAAIPKGRWRSGFLPVCAAVGKNNAEKTSDGLAARPMPVFLSSTLYTQCSTGLVDEMSTIRRLSSMPVDRTFVYLDVSDFSKFPPGQQSLIASTLSVWGSKEHHWLEMRNYRDSLRSKLDMICIGDGYIFVFADPRLATIFASYLAYMIEVGGAREVIPVRFHFRIGIHCGPVYHFIDHGRTGENKWNYIGDGINGGARVLQAIGKETDDVIFISDAVRESFHGRRVLDRDLLAFCINRGRRNDKHGNPWRVYEFNHAQLVADHIREHETKCESKWPKSVGILSSEKHSRLMKRLADRANQE